MKNCLFFQSLTNGSGFFLSDAREMVGEGRHVVLRHRETGEFIDDFTNKGKRKNSKEHLCLKKDRKDNSLDSYYACYYCLFCETGSCYCMFCSPDYSCVSKSNLEANLLCENIHCTPSVY